MKLTNDQIESIRAVSPELAEKLEAGEKVTVEKEVKRWEPQAGRFFAGGDGIVYSIQSSGYESRLHGSERKTREQAERFSHDQRIFNRLHAYRDEFAPGYVVPEFGEKASFPCKERSGQWSVVNDYFLRSPTAIYMPENVCEALCDKLNSGEVVL